MTSGYLWDIATAYAIGFDVQNGTPDTAVTSGAIINVTINGSYLSTGNSNKGIQISGYIVGGTGVDLNATLANTAIMRGQYVELAVVAGISGDSKNLRVDTLWIFP